MQNKNAQIKERLTKAGIENPRLETELILERFSDEKIIEEIINKRLEGWPLDKLLNSKGFYKHDFYTDENVLSPRPDTEILVEEAIKIINNQKSKIKNLKLLDLGVGSGCILLSILLECPNVIGTGIDISPKALEVAEKNLKLINYNQKSKIKNLKLSRHDWFKDKIEGTYDIIVSNPPYIPSADIKNLDKEVREHDPVLALDGGDDGLDSYRRIAKIANQLLTIDGYILLEVGINQADAVVNIFTEENFKLHKIAKDLSGIDRCIIFKKTGCN